MTPFARTLIALTALVAVSGCLEEPGIEEQWTRLDFVEPPAADSAGVLVVQGRITYRRILTGSVIAEVRVSPTVAPDEVPLSPDLPRDQMLAMVNRILAESEVVAGANVLVTGWDHLMQDLELHLEGSPPDPPPGGGTYLLLYFGQVEEVEMPGGEEIEIIHPADFEEEEILPIGVPILPAEETAA
jgi:hypothetical protein